jgi:hypothetical protein
MELFKIGGEWYERLNHAYVAFKYLQVLAIDTKYVLTEIILTKLHYEFI